MGGWATGITASSKLALSLCHTSNSPTAPSSPSSGKPVPPPYLLFSRDPEPFDLPALSFEQLFGQRRSRAHMIWSMVSGKRHPEHTKSMMSPVPCKRAVGLAEQ